MLYYIENENLKVAVSDKGAELFSVVSKNDGCEYVWQGDPKYWEDRAPILFPICCRLFDGYCTYRGEKYSIDITASGGVTDITDIKALREMNLYGAIIGKAYYTGAIDLKEAIEVAK